MQAIINFKSFCCSIVCSISLQKEIRMQKYAEIQIPQGVPPGSVIGKGGRCLETIIQMLHEPCKIHIKV